MSESKGDKGYNLQEISGGKSWEQLCKKQEKLIDMLNKQVNQLKQVIIDMEGEINKYELTIKQLTKQYNIPYKGLADLQSLLPQLKSLISQFASLKSSPSAIQFKQVIKQVPVFIEKQIEIIKQIEKPIFVEKIREVEKPVFVEKIIQMPCASCQLASHKRIKT